jgi:PAS domain S-box-containing protein
MQHTDIGKATHRSQNNTVWFIVITAIVIMGVMLGVRCFADYRQEVQLLEERLMAQARVVDENLNANLSAICLILENIRQQIDTAHITHNSQLDRYLKMQGDLVPGIRTLLITDSRGRCIQSSRDDFIGRDFSDRDYFITPRASSDGNLIFMSPPFKSLLNKLIIIIVKPIIGKQGGFNGVVAVSLEPEYFQTLLQSTIYAPDNRIGLVHSDGTVFTAIPDGKNSVVGQNLMKPGSQFFRHIREGKQTSIQSGRSKTTGDNRVFAYITNNPKNLRIDKHLVVGASRNLDIVLEPWKIDSGIQLSLYVLFSGIIIFTTRNMLRRGAELNRLQAIQASILESAGEGILGLDSSGKILFCNQAAGRLTGRSSSDLIGHNFHTSLHSDESGHNTADCPLFLTLKDGTSRSVIDCVMANRISVEHTVSPLIEQNEITGAVIVFRDVTEQRKLEREHKYIDDELHKALETATASNVTMSRLMNIVAHEFRTPLGLLTGSVDILDRYWDRLTPAKRTEQNERIRSAARQIASLVNSVMSFNKLGIDSSEQSSLIPDIGADCRAIVAEIEAVWSSGQQCNVTVAADCSSGILDKVLLRRILENLLGNAFRYTPLQGTVSLHVRREHGVLLLEITDSGIGIPAEDHKLIFEPFYRSNNVEGRRGLGLGLSIVSEAVAQMGGTITISSRLGVGTTVMVTIPVTAPESNKNTVLPISETP